MDMTLLLDRKRQAAPPLDMTSLLDRKRRPEARNCGTGEGGFQPGNTCAKGGDGAPPATGAQRTWAEARAENAKHLERIRKEVIAAADKYAAKFHEKSKLYHIARTKVYAIDDEYMALKSEYEQLTAKAIAEGGNSPLWNDLKTLSEKIMANRLSLEPAEKAAKAADRASIKAREEMRNATAITLGKEVARVAKEDGRTDLLKNREKEVARYWEKSPDRFVNDNSREEFARNTTSQAELADAIKPLHEMANAELHFDALRAGVKYMEPNEKQRASAASDIDRQALKDRILAGSTEPAPSGSVSSMGKFLDELMVPGHVNLPPNAEASTIIHEYGHQIEFGSREGRALLANFSEARTVGEKEIKFSEEFPGIGYEDDEVGRADNFEKAIVATTTAESGSREARRYAAYVGKRYEGNSTEILSMGLEMMVKNGPEFAKADPEFFDIVAGVVTGRVLNRTREERKRATAGVPFTP